MINHINFLKLIGVKYYLSEKKLTIKESQYKTTNIDKKDSQYNIEKDDSPYKILQKKLINNYSQSKLIEKIRVELNSINQLSDLKKYVLSFKECKLKFFAQNTVFGDGESDNPKILVIGEAPGATEDKEGKPFCGRSGILLDKMLESINLSRKHNVYVTNTVFWRPPANRRPTTEEIEICRPIVERHIYLLKPKLIMLVGNTAISSLLSEESKISQLQGQINYYHNQYLQDPIYISAIFHPSYLLKQPLKKRESWKTLIKIKKFLEENNVL